MFTDVFTALDQGILPDWSLLGRRFDMAMTKKLAVVKLPPCFWMQDPKINPRADQLFKVALLLKDIDRCGLAVAALAVEVAEQKNGPSLDNVIRQVAGELQDIIPTAEQESLWELAETLLSSAGP